MNPKKIAIGVIATLAVLMAGKGNANPMVGLAMDTTLDKTNYPGMDTEILINANKVSTSAHFVPIVMTSVYEGGKLSQATVSMKSYNELMRELLGVGLNNNLQNLLFSGNNEQNTYVGNFLSKTQELEKLLNSEKAMDIGQRFSETISATTTAFTDYVHYAMETLNTMRENECSEKELMNFAIGIKTGAEKEISVFVKELTSIIEESIQYQKENNMPRIASDIKAIERDIKEKFPSANISAVKDVLGGDQGFNSIIKSLLTDMSMKKMSSNIIMDMFNFDNRSIDEKLNGWYEQLQGKNKTAEIKLDNNVDYYLQ